MNVLELKKTLADVPDNYEVKVYLPVAGGESDSIKRVERADYYGDEGCIYIIPNISPYLGYKP